MIDWNKIKQGTTATPSPPPPGGINWEAVKRGTAPTRPAPKGTFLSGGAVSDVFDILRVGEFAVGGLLSGKGVRRGIKERTESAPEFKRLMLQAGLPDNKATQFASFVTSLVVDPINLVGTGLLGKGLRVVGAGRAATGIERASQAAGALLRTAGGKVVEEVAERVPAVERAVRGARGRKVLEPIIERQVIEEAQGIERSIDLAKAIRKDARQLTRDPKSATRLDQTLGGYFDVGADAMMNRLAQGADLQIARTAGIQAQEVYLRSLPADERGFVQKWLDPVRIQDADFAAHLVRVGMMKPETAAKWEGLHIRRIYQKFEDPHAFVEFLERADPAEAARLLGQLERGIPIRQVGQPIPTAVTKARELISATRQAELGVIEQASSRIAAGGTLASQAIARGEAYAKIATQFAVDDSLARSVPEAAQLFRQMPETAGWGRLAGKWLPKEIADPLLRMAKKPEGLIGFIEKATGWFKFSKVILNPSTHFRNIRTNIALAHNAAGLGALNPATWGRALREVLTNGQAFREAKGVSSVFIDTFTRTELRGFIADASERGLINFFRRTGAKFARAYQTEEQVGKMAVYLTARGRGLSPEAAAKLAEVALFNYRKVPPAIESMRRIGIYPFITFPYKVLTETLPLAVRRPGRFAQQTKIIQGVGEPLTGEEERNLPAWMRTGGWLKLPFKVNGHPVLFDLSFELAFGDIGESGTPATAVLTLVRRLRAGEPLDDVLREVTPFGTPLVQVAAEIILNRSAFQGREVFTPQVSAKQQAGEIAQHLARFAAPGIVSKTVLPGGELRRSIEGAVLGGRTGLTPGGIPPLPVAQAAASTLLGLKTRPLDVPRERRSRRLELQRQIGEVDFQIRRVRRNRAIDADEKRKRIRELVVRRKTLQQRFRETGTVEIP